MRIARQAVGSCLVAAVAVVAVSACSHSGKGSVATAGDNAASAAAPSTVDPHVAFKVHDDTGMCMANGTGDGQFVTITVSGLEPNSTYSFKVMAPDVTKMPKPMAEGSDLSVGNLGKAGGAFHLDVSCKDWDDGGNYKLELKLPGVEGTVTRQFDVAHMK